MSRFAAIGGAVLAGLIIGSLIYVVVDRSDGSLANPVSSAPSSGMPASIDSAPGPSGSAGSESADDMTSDSTGSLEPADDPHAFLDWFRRSRTGTYELRGVLHTTSHRGEEEVEVPILTVRLGTDSVERIGNTTIITAEGEQQQCDQIEAFAPVCGSIRPAIAPEQQIHALETLIVGPNAPYLLFAMTERLDHRQTAPRTTSPLTQQASDHVSPTEETPCWSLVSREPIIDEQWGQSTSFCFDPHTAAVVFEQTVGRNGTRTLEARVTKNQITLADLAAASDVNLG